jgi:outer membrane lipoprotein LolB
MSRTVAIAACGVLLAACAVQPVRTPAPVTGDPGQHQAWRESMLAARTQWSLQGRVAVSNGRDGGSGRIDWRQHGARYEVALSAPVTRQSWRLSGEPGTARLEGIEGGPRSGSDATALLLEATRWEIPVAALASWVRGARASVAQYGAANPRYGPDGRLAQLAQAGWTIDYADWRPVAPAASAAPLLELPHRLNATRGQATVRLIVDEWGEGPDE